MNINPQWGQEYAPSECERGKFVSLDMSTITDYPSSGRGKFALLTYDVANASPSGSASLNVLPNATQNFSTTYTSAVSVITFSPSIKYLEIFNKSSANYAYINWNPVTFSALVSSGLPIPPGSFYNIDRNITTLYIGADNNSDLRVIGHYTL